MTPIESIIYVTLILLSGYALRFIQEIVKAEDVEQWFY